VAPLDPTTSTYVLAGSVLRRIFAVPESPAAVGLVLAGGTIERLLREGEQVPPDAHVYDFRPHLIAPGTIDVHTHGAVECSFSSGPPDDTLAICRYRATTGCTGLLATITGRWDELLMALEKLGRLCGTDTGGAQLLGIHVEGPFLNPTRKGAIDEATMRIPSVDDLRRMQDAAGGWIKMMTIAPELPGALPVIEAMIGRGVVPSVGHTDATYEDVVAAVAAGAKKSTHTFNAMRPLHHRDPGTVGGVLAEHLIAELIPDGVHVHPGAMRVLLNAKGPAGTMLVTDGVRYAGLPDGVYERPGRGRAIIRDGVALTEDGTIAGSVSPMNHNFRVLRDRTRVPWDYLFEMAAAVPARLLDLDRRKGTLARGKEADFAVYDANFNCLATFVGGRQVYAADGPSASS